MIQILLYLNLSGKSDYDNDSGIEEQQHTHPAQKKEYVRLMFRHFAEMHKYDHIKIPSNIVWQLCMCYGRVSLSFNLVLSCFIVFVEANGNNYRYSGSAVCP